MSNIILSILIRTIPGREAKLKELMDILNPQKNDEVEILIDDTYPMMMGTKCNKLVADSKGEYVVFIDDDDLVPHYYVKTFINAIKESRPDCISIEGICMRVDLGNQIVYKYVQALHNKVWAFETPTLLRTDLTQIGAVKKSISLQCPFPDIMYYEDRYFAESLKKVAKTEVHLLEIMYIHRYTPTKEYKI